MPFPRTGVEEITVNRGDYAEYPYIWWYRCPFANGDYVSSETLRHHKAVVVCGWNRNTEGQGVLLAGNHYKSNGTAPVA